MNSALPVWTFALLLGVPMCGCTAHRMNRLQVGMTPAQVRTAVGNPETQSGSGNQMVWHYRLVDRDGGPLAPGHYRAVFTNGKLTAYGKDEADSAADYEQRARVGTGMQSMGATMQRPWRSRAYYNPYPRTYHAQPMGHGYIIREY